MARKSKATLLDEIHSEAITRFDECQTREQQQRTLAVDDLRFRNEHDGQWDDASIEKRKDQPRFTINRIDPAVLQVVGDQRQNKLAIKVLPASGDADKDIAKIYEGLIRNIENKSQAGSIYDAAFEEGVTCGYGGWRLTTEYANQESFNQDIRIRPINCAATSLYFGYSESYDKRDAMFAFYTAFISKSEFKNKYPDAIDTSFAQNDYTYSGTWYREGEIRIAEYWRKVPITKTIALMSDGRVLDVDEEAGVLDELAFNGITEVKRRTVDSYKVEMYVMNGVEILGKVNNWAGRFIPLVPYYGKVAHIEGKDIVSGLVRNAKDPSRIYNYATSATIEAVALSPKDPYWVTPTNVGEFKSQYENFNTRNSPFMYYNPDPLNGNAPPQRGGAPSVQQALMTVVQQAALDVETTTGLYAASMGNAPQLLSERSVQSQAEKGDRGMFIYADNLQKSILYTGDILVDLIPRIYDTETIINVLGEDGTREVLKINEQAFDEFNQPMIDSQTGQEVIVNDLSRGCYDVEVSVGAAYSTKKKESLEQLIELTQASDEFAAISGDLIAKSLDVIDGEEIAKRMRKIYIKNGIAEPTEEEIEEMGLNQPQQPNPEQEALIANIQSETQKNEALTVKTQSDIEKQMADTRKILAEAEAQELENDLVESGMIDLLR